MAKYTLGDKAAKQIAGLLKKDGGPPGPGRAPVRGQGFQELYCTGKLDTTLAPNGTATLSIYKPSTTGGIGTDTTINLTVIDNGKLDATLPASTICDVNYSRGAWIVTGFKCI